MQKKLSKDVSPKEPDKKFRERVRKDVSEENFNVTRKKFYSRMVKALFDKAEVNGEDFRDYIRVWIPIFEESNVSFDRNLFLDCCSDEKERRSKYEEKQ